MRLSDLNDEWYERVFALEAECESVEAGPPVKDVAGYLRATMDAADGEVVSSFENAVNLTFQKMYPGQDLPDPDRQELTLHLLTMARAAIQSKMMGGAEGT